MNGGCNSFEDAPRGLTCELLLFPQHEDGRFQMAKRCVVLDAERGSIWRITKRHMLASSRPTTAFGYWLWSS